MKISQTDFLGLFTDTRFRYLPERDKSEKPKTSNAYEPEWNEKGYGAFFTVSGFDANKKDRTEKNLTYINAFYTDIDWEPGITREEKLSRIQTLVMECYDDSKPVPTLIVETKKGAHFYWLLHASVPRTDTDLARWRAINLSIINYFAGDLAAKDPCRILRVPETVHWKDPKDPFTISVHHYAPENRYSFDEMSKAFPPAKDTKPVRDAESHTNDFPQFVADRIEAEYPRLSRPSSLAILDKTPGAIPEGKRNALLHISASLFRMSGKTIQDAMAYFTEYHGLPLKEIRNTVRSAYTNPYTYGWNNPLLAPYITAEEKARVSAIAKLAIKEKKDRDEAFYLQYEKNILQKHPNLRVDNAGRFYDYQDGVYSYRTDDQIYALVYKCMDADELHKYASRSRIQDKIAAVRSLVADIPFTPDQDPDILNVANGYLNMKTLALTPHTPEYVSVAQSPVAYDPKATAPIWEEFIYNFTEGMRDEATLLQQYAGYCLTSETKHEKALVMQGTGGNGKGVFLYTLTRVIGASSVSHLKMEAINERFGLSNLYGKKLNIINEVGGNYFESDVIKQIISGEPLSAEIKNKQEPLVFNPFAKIILLVNDLPRMNDNSEGLYRRLIVMTFDQRYSDEADPDNKVKQKDPDLKNKLMEAELPGILNWMLAGLTELRKNNKFIITAKNTANAMRYRQDNSPLREYLEEGEDYEKSETGSVLLAQFYKDYKEYCYNSGYKPKAVNNIGKELRTIGYRIEKDYKSGLSASGSLAVKGLEKAGEF